MKKLSFFLRVFLGIVFIFSAYTKLVVPGLIEIILIDHNIVSTRESAAIIVRMLIGFEFALGLLFFQPYSLKLVVIPAALFFLFGFTVYLGYTGFILRDTQNCGCFGEIIKMSPIESIVKNLFLIVLILALYRLIKVEKKKLTLPAILVVLSCVAVLIASPIRDLKDFKFEKYTYFEGKGRVDLSSGENIVAVFSLDCEHCQQTAKELGELRRRNVSIPETYLLFYSEGGLTVNEFNKITKTNFPYRMIDTKEFFDLIGEAPPRFYLLVNGEVKEVWDKDFITKMKLLHASEN